MACSRGKASPNAHVKLQLFAASGGYCQKPDCSKNLFLEIGDNKFHIAEMAHIFSASDKGPRVNKIITKEERGRFDNLILLCPSCHTIIDKAEEQFSDALLKNWKSNHIEKINNIFNIKPFKTRIEVRDAIKVYLFENRTVFDEYGPLTDERFNPESELQKKWKAKIFSTILPNNRKIYNIVSQNYNLLTETEIKVFEKFKQHVQDFEDKHLNRSEISGILFPPEMNSLFL